MSPSLPITTLYAVILGSLLLLFSFRVVALKGNPLFFFLNFGKKEEDTLERAVRGHGNFIEYVPTFLILLLLAELHGADTVWLHVSSILFCVGRVVHGVLFCFLTLKSPPMRIFGMTGTFFGILGVVLLAALSL